MNHLSIEGFEDALKKLEALTAAFNKLDDAKRDLNDELKKKIEVGDAAAVSELNKRIAELEKELKNLDKQRQASAKEIELLSKAELNEAKAQAVRTKSAIDQEKELDRQIAKEEKLKKTIDVLPGSYLAVNAAYREALKLYQGCPKRYTAL